MITEGERLFNEFPKIPITNWPKITGVFVSVILEKSMGFHRAKTLDQWKAEFIAMDDIGIEYIIVQAIGGYNNINNSNPGTLIRSAGNFQPYMSKFDNQIDFIFEASDYVGKLKNKKPIAIWLGTISGFNKSNKDFDVHFNALMTDLFEHNGYQNKPNWGGLYLSNECAIVKRIDKWSCKQTLIENKKNWPNWLEYANMISNARKNGYIGKIGISPVYRPVASPYADIPKTCIGRWVTTNLLKIVDADSALLSMISDANCNNTELKLTDVWIQDGMGFRWVKDAFQVQQYFSKFKQIKTTNINYNMECFKTNNPSSCTPGQMTKSWAELYISFRAAYASGFNRICAYEWLTNWSPHHTAKQTDNKIVNYTKYKNLVLGKI